MGIHCKMLRKMLCIFGSIQSKLLVEKNHALVLLMDPLQLCV